METNARDFWSRLEEAQSRTGKTNLQALCRLVNIPYQTVINQKCQGRYPSVTNIIAFASVLNCSIDWLVLGPGEEASLKRIDALVNKIRNASSDQIIALEVFLRDTN